MFLYFLTFYLLTFHKIDFSNHKKIKIKTNPKMKHHSISMSNPGGPLVIDHWINNTVSDSIVLSKKKSTKN